MILFLFFVSLISSQPVHSETTIPKNDFSFTEKLIELSKAKKTLLKTVESLPDPLKKNYVLNYDSRALQSASLLKPRVIFYDDQMNSFFSISGNNQSEVDQAIEIAEKGTNGDYQFSIIQFKNNNVVIEKNPKACAFCHSSGVENKNLPLFESYPQWVGFYGSFHNGQLYDPKAGVTARVLTPNFETENLKKFISSNLKDTVYATLPEIKKLTIEKLRDQNFNVSETIIHERLMQWENHLVQKLNKKDLFSINTLPLNPKNKEIIETENITVLNRKLNRTLKLFDKYGDDFDKNEAKNFGIYYSTTGERENPPLSFRGIVSFDLDKPFVQMESLNLTLKSKYRISFITSPELTGKDFSNVSGLTANLLFSGKNQSVSMFGVSYPTTPILMNQKVIDSKSFFKWAPKIYKTYEYKELIKDTTFKKMSEEFEKLTLESFIKYKIKLDPTEIKKWVGFSDFFIKEATK